MTQNSAFAEVGAFRCKGGPCATDAESTDCPSSISRDRQNTVELSFGSYVTGFTHLGKELTSEIGMLPDDSGSVIKWALAFGHWRTQPTHGSSRDSVGEPVPDFSWQGGSNRKGERLGRC
jgi:hypothetical protein